MSMVSVPTLKLVRTDSLMSTVRRTYEMPSGVQVVLVELPTSTPGANFTARDMRAEMQRAAPVTSGAVVTGTPAPPPPDTPSSMPVQSAAAPNEPPVSTIEWKDELTARRYMLSGRVSVEELLAIKAQLTAPKH